MSCTGADAIGWAHVGFDAGNSNVYPSAIARFGAPALITEVELGMPAEAPIQTLIGDMVGSRAPEIVTVAGGRISIRSLGGRLLYQGDFGSTVAGFLADYDRDGKMDLFLGTTGHGRPEFRVLNGSGAELAVGRDPRHTRDYRAFIPVDYRAGVVLMIGQRQWSDSPRGIGAYHLPGFTPAWEFAVPFDPLGLTACPAEGRSVEYVVSQFTTTGGTFPYIGTDRADGMGLDSSVHLVHVGADGALLAVRQVTRGGERLRGSAHFLVGRDGDPGSFIVLHHGSTGEIAGGAEEYSVLVVEAQSGTAVAAVSFPGADELHLRTVRSPDGGAAVVALAAEGDEYRMTVYDALLTPARARSFVARHAFLGPVLADPEEGADRFFLVRDTSLVLFDAELEEIASLPIRPARSMAYVERAGQGYAALSGDYLQIVALPSR